MNRDSIPYLLLAIFGSTAVIAGLILGKNTGYNRGYSDGKGRGFSEGYRDGEEEGFQSGTHDAVMYMQDTTNPIFHRAGKIIVENFNLTCNHDQEFEDE